MTASRTSGAARSSLNLHVHLHTCALDGVYVEGDDGAAPRFVPAASPSRAELFVLTERVALRVMTWLRKREHAKNDDDHASNETPERSFAELLAILGTQRGTVENVKDDSSECDGSCRARGSTSRRSGHAQWLQPSREPHHRRGGRPRPRATMPLRPPSAAFARALSTAA